VTSVRPRSTAFVPRIATMPMPRGSRAATALPKAITSSTSVTGRAISSARVRSSWMIVCISCRTATGPPTFTSTGPCTPRYEGAMRSRVSPISFSSPVIRAAISASRPSFARRAGAVPDCQ
jgi:hypothetical protein